METVTKCYNSAKPQEKISIEAVKSELLPLSLKDSTDYFTELIHGGYVVFTDVSYHLN